MTRSNKIFKLCMIILVFVLSLGLIACGETDADKAKAFDEIVDALPATVALTDKDAVVAARAAYVELTVAQKELVTTLPKLVAMEKRLEDLQKALEVDNKITALPLPAAIALTNKAAIVAARAAHTALDTTQKAMVTKLAVLVAAEAALLVLETNAANLAAATAVDALITALPLPAAIVLADNTAIEAARAAYVALSEVQKALVEELDVLVAAEAVLLDITEAYDVDVLILALPAVIALANKANVVAARAAYDALTVAQQALVEELEALEAAELAIIDLEAANAVDVKINNLPANVILASQLAIEAARASYVELTEAQKALVTKLDILVAKEATLAILIAEKEAADLSLAQINNVITLINALPVNIQLTDEDAIVAAKTAYLSLTSQQKPAVTNYMTLVIAENEIETLKIAAENAANAAAAASVDTLISALPLLIALSEKANVEAARAAYVALTDTQKGLVTQLDTLVARELRIANLEAAKPVVDLITLLPATVATTDEDQIVAARTAYTALTEDQQALVTNYDVLLEKEQDLEFAKNPDLIVIFPIVASVPTQIVDDYVLPTPEGVSWAYKAGQDQSFYDIETGEFLRNVYSVQNVVLIISYNTTEFEVTINFGLVGEGLTPIFYVGGAAADKPAAGPAWDGHGSYETQLAKAGFDGQMIVIGNKVYFVSHNAYIPLTGTTENELISKDDLRPNGLAGGFINSGLRGYAAPASYGGAAALYHNAGDLPITFDASDTYGRANNGSLGFGKVMFKAGPDGTYTVQSRLADHGTNDGTTSSGQLIVTLLPGDYLWTPHSWEVDYSAWGIGTRLCQLNNGALTAGAEIKVIAYKDLTPSQDEQALNKTLATVPTHIINDTLLPKTNGVTWTLKNPEDASIYDVETGELMRLVIESTPVVFIATRGTASKEVTIKFGIINDNLTQWYYNAGTGTAPVAGNGTIESQIFHAGLDGYMMIVGGNQYFIGKNAYIPISADVADTILARADLRPHGLVDHTQLYNTGIIKGAAFSERGYGALYFNSGTTTLKFDLSDTYGRNSAGFAGYAKMVFAPQTDGTYKVLPLLPDTGTNTTTTTTPETLFTLNPGEYLWAPHWWERDTTLLFQPTTSRPLGVLAVDTLVSIVQYKKVFPVLDVETLFDALPAEITLANEAQVVAARAAYTALNAGQQAAVNNLEKLEVAEAAIAVAQAQYVQGLIAALPAAVDITLANEAAVEAARAAYDALTLEQKILITNLYLLVAAEEAIFILSTNADDLAAAQAVDTIILALPETVTIEDKDDVEAARAAYEALTENQKLLVSELDLLEDLEADIAVLEAHIADLAAAEVVELMISALPLVITEEDEEEVLLVKAAYDALTAAQKLLVPNVAVLDAAFVEISIFEVIALIAALPEVFTLEDKAQVGEARAAYELIPVAKQGEVSNYAILQAAEAALIPLVEALMADIVADTLTHVLVNYTFDTNDGDFVWSFKAGQDGTVFNLTTGVMLKTTMKIAQRTLVITSVDFPTVTTELVVNFGMTPVGTVSVINGNQDTGSISTYYTQPYNGYTMAFTKSAVNYLFFTVYSQEITASTTNFKPTRTATSIGLLYVNKTGADKTILLSDTWSTSGVNEKLVIAADGKLLEKITTYDTGTSVTIPADGSFWLPMYLDGPIAGNANALNYNMKITALAINDIILVRKGAAAHMPAA